MELINEFSKVAEHIFNIQKSILFVYGSNKQTEDTIKKTISFTIKSKK